VPDEYNHVTTLFLAPEQLNLDNYTLEPDVFAIGVLTYFLLTGRFPLHRDVTNCDLQTAIKEYLVSIANHHD